MFVAERVGMIPLLTFVSKYDRVAPRQFPLLDSSISMTDSGSLELYQDLSGSQRFKLDGSGLKG